MAQKAQDAHKRKHIQIVEQIAPDHFTRVRNNNLLLSETIELIEQLKVGDFDIIECGI